MTLKIRDFIFAEKGNYEDETVFQRKDAYDTIPRAQSELSLREPRDEQAVGSDGSSSTASSSATLALQESQADKVKEEGYGGSRPLSLVKGKLL